MSANFTSWLTQEMSAIPGVTVQRRGEDAVIIPLSTQVGDTELIFQEFSHDAVGIQVQVIYEPQGAQGNLLKFRRDLDEYRNTLFDRRIDWRDGQLFLGCDLVLPQDGAEAREIISKTVADLVEDLTRVRITILRLIAQNQLKAPPSGPGVL